MTASQAASQSRHSGWCFECLAHSTRHDSQTSAQRLAACRRWDESDRAMVWTAPQTASISRTRTAHGPSDVSPAERRVRQCVRQVSPLAMHDSSAAASAARSSPIWAAAAVVPPSALHPVAATTVWVTAAAAPVTRMSRRFMRPGYRNAPALATATRFAASTPLL